MKNYKKAVQIYETGGQYAVYDAVKNGTLQADSWRDCIPCEDRTPHDNDACLVCGTSNKGDSIKTVDVWLGDFEFGEFKKGNDLYQLTIVHRLDDIKRLAPDDIEDYAWGLGVEWLVPEEYKGEIVYARGAQ